MNNFYKFSKLTKSLVALCFLVFLTSNLLGQNVECPANVDLGTFNCANIDEVPSTPNSPDAAMAAPYNLVITGIVGSTRVASEDSGVIFYCADDPRMVTRTITVYEDVDFSFSLTDGDPILGTCDFTIATEPDTEAPIFEAPVDIELSCGIDIDDLTQTGMVAEIIDNNCPVNFIDDYAFYADAEATGDCPNVLIITRSWTAVDPCGNTSETVTQKITLVDTEGPEFAPPADVTLPCGSDPTDLSLTGSVDDASITDACDITSTITANFVDIETLENTPCAGSTTIIRRWGAVDRCGNPNTVDQMIVIECPADCSNTDPCLGDIVTDPLPGECDCQVVTPQVLGCTDPSAANYDANANCDDGSCAGDFDLALRKTLSSTGPFAPGGDVNFTITIFNQGDVTAQNITITDHIPAGLILNDSDWTDLGATATYVLAGPLAAGDDASVEITFTIDPNAAPGPIENVAEISSAEDEDGNPGMDIDSTPDDDPNNDNLTDDEINNGDDDEDDHDIAVIEIACIDGCTDPNACNFDSAATCDDGSCQGPPTCNTDPCSGDVEELGPDGCSCVLVAPQVLGCTDPMACNYNASANCEDNSCLPFPVCNTNPCRGDITELQDCECVVVEAQVLGCNDEVADNYNPSANCNDGSCTYPSPCPPKMRVCAGPGSPIEICLPCILSGELDAQITDVSPTNGSGNISGLDDVNSACFNYTPAANESGMTELVVEYCKPATGQCWTILVLIDIDPACGDGTVTCPDELEFCTNPTTPIEICIDCMDPLGYEYTNVVSLFYCSLDDLDDENQACFTYTPVPLMELYSPDQVTATYCIPGTDICHTTVLTIYIKDNCGDEPIECEVSGGTLTGGPYTFCVGDDEADIAADVSLSGDSGDFSSWVITDDNGNVLAVPGSITDVDFDIAGSGTCLIWNISYDSVSGLYQGSNASDFEGCYSLSNPITVNRTECEQACEVNGGTISGGPFTFCVGDGTPDYVSGISLTGNSGSNTAWVITNESADEILGLPSMPGAVDFDAAGEGSCLIWSVSFDQLVGAYVGANPADLSGCFELSNSITVNRITCAIECPDVMSFCTTPTTEIEICIPCIADGSFDATITDVNSLFNCGIDDLDDDNQACFSYTPLPLMQNYSPDIVTVEYCTAAGECMSTEVIMEIKVDCGGAVINTLPNNFNEDLLQLQPTELSEKTLLQLETAPVIYPIPSGDFINVALKAEIETANLTIYNSSGQTMKTKVVENSSGELNTLRLDISNFESGIYYLVAGFGDSLQATQFIKK